MARTARRLGATEARIVYRRTREKMPAHDFELEQALQEGVMVKWLSTIRSAGDGGALTIEKMRLDERGQAVGSGEFETLEADSLVLTLGQEVDLSLLDGVPGLELKDGVSRPPPGGRVAVAGPRGLTGPILGRAVTSSCTMSLLVPIDSGESLFYRE